MTNLNLVLAAVHTPSPGYVGSDLLLLDASDRGYSGVGGAKNASGSVRIEVQRVNQPISVGASLCAHRSGALNTSRDTRAYFSLEVADVDAFFGAIGVQIAVRNGSISLPLYKPAAQQVTWLLGAASPSPSTAVQRVVRLI